MPKSILTSLEFTGLHRKSSDQCLHLKKGKNLSQKSNFLPQETREKRIRNPKQIKEITV